MVPPRARLSTSKTRYTSTRRRYDAFSLQRDRILCLSLSEWRLKWSLLGEVLADVVTQASRRLKCHQILVAGRRVSFKRLPVDLWTDTRAVKVNRDSQLPYWRSGVLRAAPDCRRLCTSLPLHCAKSSFARPYQRLDKVRMGKR